MNRNIIVKADVPELYLESGTDDPNAPKPDDYFSRLLKYVPVEIISAYLIVAGVLESAYPDPGAPRRYSLGALLIVGMAGSYLYAQRVNKVLRRTQLVMTAAAFAVWVFATGGIFQTGAWWHPWMGTVAVVLFGVSVRIIGLDPLPPAEPATT